MLGPNDSIVSTASLLVGVASAQASRHTLLITGLAVLVAGAMSMAAGEFVSVSSQADSERADLAREQRELQLNPPAELGELAINYQRRGLTPSLAHQVAEQLTAHNALAWRPMHERSSDSARSREPDLCRLPWLQPACSPSEQRWCPSPARPQCQNRA